MNYNVQMPVNPCTAIAYELSEYLTCECELCHTPIEPGSCQALLRSGILCGRCVQRVLDNMGVLLTETERGY